ncbi:MAG: hybrid sensor histidine kinase/response regulator [Desulfuromonadales bacterium C00003093]|nr:MAG: hybrid sensor histidine kinase/response regulator [Desulfuromonadales bacterium C00003093]
MIQDDETLKLYIEESLEHLADIENDFLAIEEAGADIDEELVNKVFRSAHSIKGGAGFMGLNNIKELAHKMENVLGMIREREMVPNPEIINILLLASDALRNLINNITTSNEIDVSEHIQALITLTTDALPDEEKENVTKMVDISFPDRKAVFTMAEYDISNARKGGKVIYLVEYDLIHDVHKKNKNPLNVLKEMQKSGIILDSKVDIEAVGTLDNDVIANQIPFLVLFATILEPDMINGLFEINEKSIHELSEDLTIRPIAEEPTLSKPTPTFPTPIKGEKKKITPSLFNQTNTDISPPLAGGAADTSLRVHVSLLDSLMNLAGELVLGRNQLVQSITSKDFRAIEATGQRLDLITTELQEAIMLTRMQPIGNILNKFPRVVRDLSRNLGKDVELTLNGKEVELDKTIIESISDPLTHLVRNSVDHGIETPDERRKAGKGPTGKVLLKAYHEAGQVNIEIVDDGKGMDGNKLTAAAVTKGLITEDQARMMSDKEKMNLIFLPGLSTAEKVTDVSGRGVGMDVVKTNLDKLGGVVDIDSRVGEGTSIRIKLPLTLAIIPSQIISTEGERYAIPQVNLKELLRIPADQVKDRIEKVGNAEVVRLRGNLLPLIRLADVIGVERTYFDSEDKQEKKDRRENMTDRRSRRSEIETGNSKLETGAQQSKIENRKSKDQRYHADSAVNIVVVTAGALKYGLVVDRLHDSEEIVVKPLGRHLKRCKGYAGATIMGDGRVALILDVAGLSQMAELTSVEGTDRASEVKREVLKSKEDIQSLLIFRNAEDEQFTVPLSLVSRIEKIKKKDMEQVGGKKVIQYRGESLPLFAIDEVANVKPLEDREDLLVIVFLLAGREVGLLATSPVDALEVCARFDESTLKQSGIMGSAIIGDHTTMMVDIFGLIETINPEWFSEREAVQTSEGKAATILYAEDSRFFRSQVKGFMEDEGYNVIEAEDGMVAWNLLQEHADEVFLVVTDVEMPNLDGVGLAGKIKGDQRFSHLPVIALTTLAGDEDMARGKEVGIDDYQVKLDREKLMESIHGLLSR